MHYHGYNDVSQPLHPTVLDHIRKMFQLSRLYICNTNKYVLLDFFLKTPEIRLVIKIDAIKLLHLPACATLQSAVAMATRGTVWDHVLLT